MHLSRIASLTLLGTLVFAAGSLHAQAPAGSTGVCKDGSYTSAKSKSGACSAHGGVKDWMGAPAAAPRPVPARPAGSTGQCGDNSFTSAASKSGACSNHGGVKEWFASAPAAKVPPPAPPVTRTPPPPAAPRTPPPAPRTPPPPAAASAPASSKVMPIPGAPAAATALCNDGTYSESQHRSGTCSNHKGVKQWLKSIPAL